MAEWLNALVLKTSKGSRPSGVRIPVPPPFSLHPFHFIMRRIRARACNLRGVLKIPIGDKHIFREARAACEFFSIYKRIYLVWSRHGLYL